LVTRKLVTAEGLLDCARIASGTTSRKIRTSVLVSSERLKNAVVMRFPLMPAAGLASAASPEN
jgi:hypothetical protein